LYWLKGLPLPDVAACFSASTKWFGTALLNGGESFLLERLDQKSFAFCQFYVTCQALESGIKAH